MAENVEKINSDKVREQVRQDGYNAAKQAIDGATKKLTDRGFDAGQVRQLVKEGVKRAANE
jgi:hypothetical protein